MDVYQAITDLQIVTTMLAKADPWADQYRQEGDCDVAISADVADMLQTIRSALYQSRALLESMHRVRDQVNLSLDETYQASL